MKKLEEKNIELLERKRVTYLIDHEKKATPSTENVLKEIAKDMKVTEDLIKIRHIYPHYGTEKAKIIAHIYKNKEALKRFEEVNKKKPKKIGEKKAEAKPAEAPKTEEKPKEEVKEDGKEKQEKQ